MARRSAAGWSLAAALLIVLGLLAAPACSLLIADEQGSAVLVVDSLGADVEGWRLRAEAFSPDLDGSPTFWFNDAERVDAERMVSAETSLGARSYQLIIELAAPADGPVLVCEAPLEVSDADALEVTVDASRLQVVADGAPAAPCAPTVVER